MDRLVRFFSIFFVLIIFFIPAFFPAGAAAAALVVWPLVYLFITVVALFHSTASHLPWTVIDPEYVSLALSGILIALAAGLVNGGKGVAGMAVWWIPMFLLPLYMVLVGVSTTHKQGWTGYVIENYNDNDCIIMHAVCEIVPYPGRQLPTIVMDNINMKITDVIPYGRR